MLGVGIFIFIIYINKLIKYSNFLNFSQIKLIDYYII